MIQHGVLTLVFSLCFLGAASVYPTFQKTSPKAYETDSDVMTVCDGNVDPGGDLVYEKVQPANSPVFIESVATEQDDAMTIWLEVVPEQMKFDQDTITVKAGRKIILELDNRDGMQHNLLILKPNTLDIVGAAADAMLRDPKASEKHYVPAIPEVLFATEMLGPNEVYTLKFTAPTTPGYYPFVCTFPGHWRMMNGIMVVEKS